MGLTVKKIERLVSQPPGRHLDTKGLYLQVSRGGASWLFRYVLDGRERWMGLGSLDLLTLEEARDERRAARKLLLKRIDPIDQKRAEKAESAAARLQLKVFEEAAREYYAANRSTWRSEKHATKFCLTCKFMFSRLLARWTFRRSIVTRCWPF
jgi:hypothetical protein